MKQIYIEKQAKDQVYQNFGDTTSRVHRLLIRVQPNSDFLNIFLIQNKGKGPPGVSRSPGQFPEHPPDISPNRFSKPASTNRTLYNNENQINNKNQISIFLTQLNFTNMKNQILFLAFFVLAVLASITDTYGQAKPSTIAPNTLNGCDDFPLHPLPGKTYEYEVTTTTTNGVPVSSYTWWATKNDDFVNPDGTANLTGTLSVTTGGLIYASPNYGAPGTASTVSITWSPQILANTQYKGTPGSVPSPTFVAVMATGDCTNNIQVYELNPLKAFTVDISSFDPTKTVAAGYGNTVSSCVDEVRGAIYDNTAKALTMDYGTNTITFEVIAANFVDTWTPLFEINGLLADQTASIGWAYTLADAVAGNYTDKTTANIADGATFSGTVDVTTNEANTALGVSIYVTVVVDNNTYETLLDQNIILTVDGVDSTGQWDLMADCTDSGNADQNDNATQVITARPTITHATDDEIPSAIDPSNFIPKPVTTP